MLSIQHAMHYILLNILFKKSLDSMFWNFVCSLRFQSVVPWKKKFLYHADGNLINFVKNFTGFKLDAVIVSIVA